MIIYGDDTYKAITIKLTLVSLGCKHVFIDCLFKKRLVL